MKKVLLVVITLLVFFMAMGCENSDDQLSYSGRVEATEVDISSEVGGIITKITVAQGDEVQKEQLLVKLDEEAASLKLREAEAAIEAAEARLKEALAGTRTQRIDSAKAAVASIKANLQQAKKDLDFYTQKEKRYKELLEKGAVDKQTYDGIELALQKAKSRVETLQSQLAQSQSQLELLQAGNTSNYIAMLRAELKRATTLKEQAELQLEKCTVTSPLNGIVSLKNFEEGELVKPGSNLLTVINLQDQWIDIYVPQSDLGKWHLQDKVIIIADAYPEHKFSGEVIYIASEAEFTPKNVQTKEARMDTVFKIKVKVLEGTDKLRPGMWVEVYRGDQQ